MMMMTTKDETKTTAMINEEKSMRKIQSIPRAAAETENDNERKERIDGWKIEQA